MGTVSCIAFLLVIISCIDNSYSIFARTEVVLWNDQSNFLQKTARNIKNFWTWMQSQPKDSFLGRCAGAFKKMRMTMTFMVFALGVILTTLAFLSIFALKSLGLLVLLVIINVGGFLAKLYALKGGGEVKHRPQNIHVHVHGGGKEEHDYPPDYPPHYKWYDKIDTGTKANSYSSEDMADIYRRIGLSDVPKGLYRSVYRDREN